MARRCPFDRGRRQIQLLAGLEITAKAVERTAEAIGGDIVCGQQRELKRAVQLDLPVVLCPPIPILYMQMDGTGIPVVNKETAAEKEKPKAAPPVPGK